MKVSIKWLEQYFDQQLDSNTIEHDLTRLGLEVEDKINLGDKISKIVAGRIEALSKHPDADKLQICSINIGTKEHLQIVTGAQNVYVGMKVPVALVGSKVIGGNISLSKLRGIESYGMLCSGAELGIENSLLSEKEKEGILPLAEDIELGQDIKEALALDDVILELGLTPNRADCYGIYNVAKEVSLGQSLKLKKLDLAKSIIKDNTKDIEIIRTDLCPRYISRIVKNVNIKASPVWFANLIRNVGIRPINNLVDITNYVMFELGHPMHAFDLDKLEGNKIIVDTGKKGEKFITLDGIERELTEDMLLIKDANKNIALAGVMGGANSEVDDNTSSILLEAASFNSACIRKTSRKLGLRSEASGRFERGLSADNCLLAMERACYLIELLEAGKVEESYQESYPVKQEIPTITCTAKYINGILGMNISQEEIIGIFNSLNFKVEVLAEEIKVTPEAHRIDIQSKIDLVEEVVRVYGYDRIPSTLPQGATNTLAEEYTISLKESIKNQMVAEGLSEIITYSFIDNKDYESIGMEYQGDDRLKIINPLSEKQSYMREKLLPGILDIASRNYKRQRKDIKIFELGNVYKGSDQGLPEENLNLGILITENKIKEVHGLELNDFYTLKGILERLLAKISDSSIAYLPGTERKTFHPGRSGQIEVKGDIIGEIGELHPQILDKYDIKEKTYYLELNLDKLAIKPVTIYSQIAKFPFVERDMAFVVPKEKSYGEMIELIKEASDNKVIGTRIFDIYEGQQIEDGYKSVAFSITYQDKDKTLTDDEVTKLHEIILNTLAQKIGAKIR